MALIISKKAKAELAAFIAAPDKPTPVPKPARPPKPRGRSLDAALASLGPAKAVAFLRLLLKWWPSAKREHSGKLWIYRPRAEWAGDLGVPMKTFEAYVTRLRRDGWIETAAFQNVNAHGKPWGVKIQHVRPTDALLTLVADATAKKPAAAKHGTLPKAVSGSLPAVWKAAHEAAYPGEAVVLASVHVKQLADFEKALAIAGMKDQAAAIVDWAVRNWGAFIAHAKSEAAAFKVPSKASAAFLVKFAEVAVNAWLAETKSTIAEGVAKTVTVAPPQLSAPAAISVTATPKAKKLSYDEMMQILSDTN